jgi:uncharacterized lipoprotein NlpE involved in copper resistance
MNRQTLAIAIALATLSIAGCKREAAAPPAVAAAPAEEIKSAVISEIDHGSPASAAPAFDIKAFAGLYAGLLPCADCPGIDTSIAFTPEGTYSMSETYQADGGGSFVSKGTWTVREDGKTVLLDPEDKEERDRWYEVVSANELRTLDRDGKAIDSKLDYSLRRK